jgi:hypothetical protein
VPGRPTGFYEWYGAGRYPVPRGAAMAEAPLIDVIRYGFDRGHLYLRLEPAPGRAGELADLTLRADLRAGERHVGLEASKAGWRIAELTADGVSALEKPVADPLSGLAEPVAFGRTIEIGVPFERLGLKPGERVQMSLRLYQGQLVRGQFPRGAPLSFTVPDEAFEAENWSA